MENLKILLLLCLTLSIHANDDKRGPKKANDRPLNIFNFIYSNSNSDAKNKPFHVSHQESKIKQQKSSSFFEKLLSMAAASVGLLAGSAYLIKSIFGSKLNKSSEALMKEIKQLKIVLKNIALQGRIEKIKLDIESYYGG